MLLETCWPQSRASPKVDHHHGTFHEALTKLVRAAQGIEALSLTGIVELVLIDKSMASHYHNEVDGLISLRHREREVDQQNQAVMDQHGRHKVKTVTEVENSVLNLPMEDSV